MEERIKEIIEAWLEKEFKNKNAIPGLVVSGLATEILNHRWEIYRYVKNEYDLEDINRAAEDREIELTDEEADIVLNKYQDSEYQDVDTIDYLLDRIIEMRKEEK